MANSNMNFSVGIKTNYDASGINQLKKELQDIQKIASNTEMIKGVDVNNLVNMTRAAQDLEKALDAAYDPQIKTINIDRFNKSLLDSNTNIYNVKSGLKEAGIQGEKAFLGAASSLLQLNKVTRESNTLLDKMATTMANTVRWGITSALWNNITGSIQTAFYYVKDLDTALNDIRIVTGKSAEDMANFAVEANNAAKALAVTTEDYTRGALIYYQQGLDDNTVKTLTDITSMTANVTGQGMDTVSEQLTAVWNGYKVANQAAEEGIGVYEEYVDKMAAVGAATASDLEELSTAMSKVASAAASMGVGFDSLNAQIATIVSVTRQAPESVGTALKTIYARMGDLELGKSDEDGVGLGQVSGELDKLGIAVLDAQGNMRDMEEVITEVGEAWDTWTEAERQAIAVALAGKRQYNNLIALFDNWTMYTDTLNVSLESAGTLQEQQAIAAESLANKMDVLRATAEDLYDNLFNEDAMKGMVDVATKLLQVLTDVVDSIGGLQTILPMIGAIGMRVFSSQIGKGIGDAVRNLQIMSTQTQTNEKNLRALKAMFQNSALWGSYKEGSGNATESTVNRMIAIQEERIKYEKYLNDEQKEGYKILLEKIEATEKLALIAEEASQKELAQQFSTYEKDGEELSAGQYFTRNKGQEVDADYKDYKDKVSKLQQLSSIVNDSDQADARKLGRKKTTEFKDILQTGALKDAYKEWTEAQKKAKEAVSENLEGLEALQEAEIQAWEKFKETVTKTAEAVQAESEAIANHEVAQAAENNAQEDVNNEKQNIALKETIDLASQATAAVGELATGFMTLSQLGNIWTDENLSGWEKLSQTISNLIIAVPMLITGFAGMTTVLNANNLAQTFNTAALALNTIARKINNEAIEDGAEANAEDTEVTLENSTAKLKEAFNTLARSGVGGLKNAITGLGTKATSVFKGLIGVIKGLGPGGVVGLAVAAVLLLAGAISSLKKSYKELSERIQENQEALENYTNKLTELADKKEKIKEQLSIEDISESNRQALEIENGLLEAQIALYEQLAKDKQSAIQQDTATLLEDDKGFGWQAQLRGLGQLFEGDFEGFFKNYVLKTISPIPFNAIQSWLPGQTIEEGSLTKAEDALKDYEKLVDNYNASKKLIAGDSVLFPSLGATEGSEKKLQDQYEKIAEASGEVSAAIEELQKSREILAENPELYAEEIAKIDEQLSHYQHIVDKLNNTNLDKLEERYESILALGVEINNTSLNPELEGYNKFEKFILMMSELIDLIPDGSIWEFLTGSPVLDFLEEVGDAFNIEELTSSYGVVKMIIDTFKEIGTILRTYTLADYFKSGLENWQMIFDNIFYYIEKFLNKIPLTSQLMENVFIPIFEKIQGFLSKIEETFAKIEPILIKYGFMTTEQSNSDEEFAKYLASLDDETFKQVTTHFTGTTDLNQEEVEEYVASLKEAQDELDKYLNNNQNFKELLTSMVESGTMDEEALSSLEEYDKLLELAGGDADYLMSVIKKLGETSITTFDSLNDLGTMESGFGALATVYEQKMNGEGDNFVDVSNLQGLYDDFGDIEGFNDFIKVMQDVNATTEESQQAFNELATSYLNAHYNLAEITDENRAYAEEALRRLGIVNAEEIVDKKVAQAQQLRAEALHDIRNAQLDTTMTTEDLENATVDELQAIYEEAAAAGYAADGLRTLILAKLDVSLQDIGAAKTIDDLLNIAGTAAFTADQLRQLTEIEAHRAEIESMDPTQRGAAQAALIGQEWKLTTEMKGTLADYIEGMQADVNAEVDVQTNFKAPEKDKNSSSSKSTKDQKDFDDEYDRYWEFNKLIEKVTDTIEDLDEAQENLHGRELISALENENRLLDKQAEAYEKLYAEQKREQTELQSSLGSLGLQFDADGAITNYAAQTSQMLSDYNKAVAEYNAGMMNEETFAIYEQNYEKFKTGLARYEELYYSEMKDAQDKLEEIRKQQRANNLEAWEIDIELKLETSEFERDVANFLHDIEDDFKKVYEDLGDDFENIFANMGTYDADVSTTLQAIKDVTAEIDKMQNGGESDMFESISQAQEKLKDLNKDLQDSASSMHDLWVDAWDTYMEGIDQSADKLEDLNEKYERIGQEIEFQGDLIKLLYGDEAYDLMADYFDAQKTNTLAQVDSFRQQRDMWKQMYESAEEGSEDQQKYYELMNEAQDNLNGSVKEYIELLQNEATNAIDGALKKYENLITNGQGLDVVNEQWERTKDYADAVFDSVEKTYHVQDLASKIKQSINDAEGLKSQQKLQELYDKEINYLLDKKELTQYDIDAANARYQIALKEIALEEAQNAKNSMKVVRGADGNWDYQYVADDENVEQKKQELSDSIYALYELANNSYMESMDNLLEIEQKYQEQAKALAEEAVKTGADVSERKRQLDEWYESEKTRISEQGALARQDMLTSSVGVLKDAYDNNVINYENMTDSQIALIEGVSQAGVDSFADLEVKVNDNFQNIGDMAHQVIAETVPEWNSAAWDIAEQWIGDDGSIKQAFEETGATLTQITEDYRADVDELGEVADMNLGEDGIAGTLQDNIELTEELEGATENLVDASVDALEEYQDALYAVEEAWYAIKDSITDTISEVREYLALMGQASNMDVSMNNPAAGKGNNWDFGTGNTGNGGKGSGSGSGSGDGEQGEEDTSLKWSYAGEGYGDNVVRILRGNKLVSIGHINDLWTQYGDAISIYDNKTTLKKKRISTTAAASNMPGFDTGGYTGEWGGGEGKVAMLHSKELVLNAKDTENILDAVSAVRSFASIGNSINEAIMSGIAKMLLSASGKVLGSVSKVDNSSNDNSQNIFHINAEFPNANDMAEIQAAILSLPRIASQQTEIIVK